MIPRFQNYSSHGSRENLKFKSTKHDCFLAIRSSQPFMDFVIIFKPCKVFQEIFLSDSEEYLLPFPCRGGGFSHRILNPSLLLQCTNFIKHLWGYGEDAQLQVWRPKHHEKWIWHNVNKPEEIHQESHFSPWTTTPQCRGAGAKYSHSPIVASSS